MAVVGATALVGNDLVVVADAAVVIADGAILTVERRADIQISEGVDVFDARGATLIPGFIDAHVHIGFAEPRAILAGGVTTVRDLGWPPARIAPLVSASRAADFAGPTILAAGPILTTPGGYPTRAAWAPPGTGLEVADPGAARGAVASVADSGAVVVKVALDPSVGPVLDPATLTAIVDAAHARGLRVTGHVYGLEQLDKAIDARMDELAHMLLSDERIPAPMLARMVEARMAVVPTLSIFSGPELRTAIANLYAFRNAGGTVVYGTDLGNEGPRPGIDPSEIRAMATAGMSGLDIIRAATVDAAGWLRLGSTGSIAEGNDADLVLIDGDPAAAPEVLTDIVAVWRHGARVR